MLSECFGHWKKPAAAESHIKIILVELTLKWINVVALKRTWTYGYSSLMASISTRSPMYLEAGISFWPECPQGSSVQLSVLNLAAGVGDIEYLTNCIMLHNRLKHGLAERSDFGCWDQHAEMLWHEQAAETRKPSMQQLESCTHRQESRHGLRFPSSTDGGAAHVRWPQISIGRSKEAWHRLQLKNL